MAQALSDQRLVLIPADTIRFRGSFNDVVTSHLRLFNPGDLEVAFKIKTTAPHQYCVKPNSGVIRPHETVTVAVMLQPFDYNPSERPRHKFMVQAIEVLPGQNADTIWSQAYPADPMEYKLRVAFETGSSSSLSSTITEEDYQMVKEKNEWLAIQIEGLQGENKQLRQRTSSFGYRQNEPGRTYTETDSLINREPSSSISEQEEQEDYRSPLNKFCEAVCCNDRCLNVCSYLQLLVPFSFISGAIVTMILYLLGYPECYTGNP